MNLQIVILVVGAVTLVSNAGAVDLFLPCTSQADCADVPLTTCKLPEGRCDCPKGYLLNGDMTKCLAILTGFGDACEDDVQCAARMLTGASCSATSKCECAVGYHYLHGRCWKSRDLGESCTSDAQCYGNFNHEALSCAAGVCACSDGFYLHPASTYCRRLGKEPGDECVFDFDCKFEGGLCRPEDQTCITSDGSGAQWTPRRTSYEDYVPAIEEAQSNAGAAPISPRLTAKLGEECSDHTECSAADPNSECGLAGTCWCERGFYNKTGVCMRELGEPCELQTDCTHITNGTCRALPSEGSICSCNIYSIPGANNQRCNRLRPELEINCQSQLETCQNFGPLCNCVTIAPTDIKCRCLEGSHFEETHQTCWQNKNLGEECSASEDCIVASGTENVDCGTDGKCQCVASYHENTGDCRKDSLVFGDECLGDIDCRFPNAQCSDSTCVCKLGYFPSNIDDGAITCLTGIGGTCTSDGDCSKVDNSMCNTTSSTCICNVDEQNPLVASTNRDTCLPVVLAYGGDCTDVVQCQAAFGDYSNCTDGACACLDSYHFLQQDQTCWNKTDLNERCYNGRDCYVPSGSDRTDCVNGFCKCQYQYVEDVEAKDCLSGGNAVHQTIGALASLVACLLVAAML